RPALVHASASQIEDRLRRQLTLGRTVSALHVVGEDLEPRFAVDLDAVGEQQVLVGLGGVGLLRIGAHDDAPVEDGAGRAVEHSLEELTAPAARYRMVDRHVMLDLLAAPPDPQAPPPP